MAPVDAAGRARSPAADPNTRNAPTPISEPLAVIVGDDLTARRARRDAGLARFGPPSTYGLAPRELAAEVGRCRRGGWLRWEISVRFGRRAA